MSVPLVVGLLVAKQRVVTDARPLGDCHWISVNIFHCHTPLSQWPHDNSTRPHRTRNQRRSSRWRSRGRSPITGSRPRAATRAIVDFPGPQANLEPQAVAPLPPPGGAASFDSFDRARTKARIAEARQILAYARARAMEREAMQGEVHPAPQPLPRRVTLGLANASAEERTAGETAQTSTAMPSSKRHEAA